MARPKSPERNVVGRSFRQLRRFLHLINPDKIFGTQHRTVHHSAAIAESAIATSTKVSEKVGARPRSAKADGLRAFTVAPVRLRLRQYPIGATTTPGMTSLLTFAIASKLPRSLKIRTGLPSPTFRARASFGLTSTNCSPA